MKITVNQLFTHPVKGLTPQAQNQVYLQAGHGIVGDRALALMYDSIAPQTPSAVVPWMRKKNFVMQCDFPTLAALACDYNPQTATLTIQRQGAELLTAQTNTITGRDAIGTFFTKYLAAHINNQRLRLVGDSTGNTRYPDRAIADVSLVSQATLTHLSAIAKTVVDVRRFRPNLVVDGIPAWAEFDFVGKQFRLCDTLLEITAPINRCLNIDVNPDTGERDLALLALLQRHFNHKQTGVLAKVITGGNVSPSAELIPI